MGLTIDKKTVQLRNIKTNSAWVRSDLVGPTDVAMESVDLIST